MSIQVSPSPDEAIAKALNDRDPALIELLHQCQKLSIQVLEPEMLDRVQNLRESSAAWVRKCTLPTTRDEEWRFTDVSFLKQVKFNLPTPAASDITPLILPEAVNSRLVFVDGVYAPTLSSVADLPELIVTNLAGLPLTHRDRVWNYLATAPGATEVFTALNTSGITDVAVVWVPKNLVVEMPIHLLFISASSEPTISQPRCLVVAESGSSVTLIEDYLDRNQAEVGSVYFTNSVTEIWLEENAQVNHTRVERDSLEAFHIGKTAIAQARSSRYTGNAITLGAKLSRHNLEVFQTGEQTETTINGLVAIADRQVADTHSAIALNHPYGTSTQLHKCIVADRSHAIFNGKIFVPQAAQLTNASQLNRNLLLSPQARVDTKPQLEITADNVKCSHGATVSQLDEEEVFYLQSRGINATAARRLLLDAFAAEIINKLPVASLRQTLTKSINS